MTENYVYKKEVDWSLLIEGLALPVKNQVVFGRIMNRFMERGERKDITIYLNGYEYDAVIILDVDDDEWPNRLTGNVQEERRLFYVAMTRARKYLYFAVSGEKLESRFLLEAGLI